MRQRILQICAGTFLIYLAFLPPGVYSVDGNSMLAVADSLVVHHNVNVPEGLGIQGRNGLIYSSWYPLQSFLAVPVVAGAIEMASIVHAPAHYIEGIAVTILSGLYTALTVSLVYLLALSLGSNDSGAFLAAFSYGFCTTAMVYTRD